MASGWWPSAPPGGSGVLVWVIALALALGPEAARAGRPLDTEDTITVAPGKAELELSLDDARNPADNSWFAKGVLSVGLSPGLEARIESALLLLEPDGQEARAGVRDSLFGVKYRVLDETDEGPAVLGALTVRLPTGDPGRGLGAEEVDVGLLAVVSKAWGQATLTLNAGYTFVTRDRSLDVWVLAASLEYRVTEAWTLVGEVVSTPSGMGGPDTALLRIGAVYAVSDRVKLDAAVAGGLTRASPDVVVTVGVTLGLF